jgi:hypothetical protein
MRDRGRRPRWPGLGGGNGGLAMVLVLLCTSAERVRHFFCHQLPDVLHRCNKQAARRYLTSRQRPWTRLSQQTRCDQSRAGQGVQGTQSQQSMPQGSGCSWVGEHKLAGAHGAPRTLHPLAPPRPPTHSHCLSPAGLDGGCVAPVQLRMGQCVAPGLPRQAGSGPQVGGGAHLPGAPRREGG